MSKMEEFRELIETQLNLLDLQTEPKGLYEPVKYVLSLGGKRLRPVLCLASAAMFGDFSQALMTAVGMEVFHNFTLLHDDIMDQAHLRRNKPTVHKKWDNNTAILSGDAMIIKAYQYLSETPVGVLPQVMQVFNKTALGVCEGQQYDMDFEQQNDITKNQYLEMIRLKTAVLIGGSMQIGAIIGGSSLKEQEALFEFGQEMGMAFQLQDDWLDVYGRQQDFGKAIGGDILANKKTFLLISALEQLDETKKEELFGWFTRKDYNEEEKIAAVTALYDEAGVSELLCSHRDQLFEDALERLAGTGGDKKMKKEIEDFSRRLMDRER